MSNQERVAEPSRSSSKPAGPTVASPGNLQLKQSLKGMSFDDGARALAADEPPPVGSAPVQREDAPGASAPVQRDEVGPVAPTGQADGSDAKAVVGKMDEAFKKLAGMKRGDPAIAGPLGDILGPCGVAVPAIDPGDERHASEGISDAVLDATVVVQARLPDTIIGKPKPNTLEDLRLIDFELQQYRNKHSDAAHPDEQYKPDLLILNKVFGLRELAQSWWESAEGGKTGRAPTSGGMAIAAYALAQVGRVEEHQRSGNIVSADDGKGGKKDVNACVGHDLLWTIFKEGTASKIVDGVGGQAGVIDPGVVKPSWCGIFANWVAIKVGMAGTPWGAGGVDITNPSKVQPTSPKAVIKPLAADPVAGDIAFSQDNNQHYCIVLRRQGDTIYTIDGNTSGGGSTTGGKIMANSRAVSWFSGFYEWR